MFFGWVKSGFVNLFAIVNVLLQVHLEVFEKLNIPAKILKGPYDASLEALGIPSMSLTSLYTSYVFPKVDRLANEAVSFAQLHFT